MPPGTVRAAGRLSRCAPRRGAASARGRRSLRTARFAHPHSPPVSTPCVIEWLMRIENPLVWSSVMIRAEPARTLDPFTRPDILYAEDFDLYHRIGRLGRDRAARRRSAALSQPCRRRLAALHRYDDGKRDPRSCRMPPLAVRRRSAKRSRRCSSATSCFAPPCPIARRWRGSARRWCALQEDFIAARRPDAESRKLIRWETARRWARIGRAGLRIGRARAGRCDGGAARSSRAGLCRARRTDPVAADRQREGSTTDSDGGLTPPPRRERGKCRLTRPFRARRPARSRHRPCAALR